MTRERTTGTRKSSTGQAGTGVAGLTVAWRVALFLPLVLTGALLAGRIDLGGDNPATEPTAQQVIDEGTPGAQLPETGKDKGKGKNDKGDKPKSEDPTTSESPTAEATDSPTSEATGTPDPDPTTPQPTKSPTKSPTKTPTQTPTDPPTPDEAEDMCREAGVNPLDLVAMAACIAEILGG